MGVTAEAAPRPGPESSLPSPRDRFVVFAFVAADLLVECSPDGLIGFSAGAFQARLGAAAEAFTGRHVSELIAPVDQTSFAVALATVASRGRILPLLVRLADRRLTPMCVAGLLVPGPPPRLCLTFGAAPAAGRPGEESGGPVIAQGVSALAQAAARHLGGDAPPAQMKLLELKGWAEARRSMGAADHDQMRVDIAAALAQAAPGSLTSEVADGRFSLLACGDLDLQGVVERLEGLLGAAAARHGTSLASADVTLAAKGMAPIQAARALRFALTCFAERGMAGAMSAGSGDGLSGIMAKAQTRARAMQQAIADGRFQLRFQPVTGLADRRVHHYEALLRPIATPGNPLTSPQEYVTFAEMVGLAEALDLAVLRLAVSTLRANRRASVAVNVSGLSMQSPEFVDSAIDLLREADLGGRLMIELTETAEISDMAAAAAHMALFSADGVPLCLDDFGAGQASFRYLREFAVDYVKIDGAFVRRAHQSPRDRAFVASIIDLAGSVKAGTVAEMIETEEQAVLMAELGADFGQGWLFGRPGLLPTTA